MKAEDAGEESMGLCCVMVLMWTLFIFPFLWMENSPLQKDISAKFIANNNLINTFACSLRTRSFFRHCLLFMMFARHGTPTEPSGCLSSHCSLLGAVNSREWTAYVLSPAVWGALGKSEEGADRAVLVGRVACAKWKEQFSRMSSLLTRNALCFKVSPLISSHAARSTGKIMMVFKVTLPLPA